MLTDMVNKEEGNMTSDQMQPVIIGSALSGMSVSRTLSKAKIPHILVGSPPNSLPRLGESLNLEGTLGLWELFPELSKYYFRKDVAVGYVGDFVFSCSFVLGGSKVNEYFFKFLGYTVPDVFLQFDRLGFDATLYKATVASNYCTPIEAKVTTIDYNATSDCVEAIHLSD